MVRYAARAVPWARVALAAVLVVVLMDVVRRWPWTTWPLEGTAVGLLAAATAWCFDEPAAAVVDVAPRGLAWRTAVRCSGVVVLVGAWTFSVVHAGDRLFGHAGTVALQGAAAIVVAIAWTAWRRRAGESSPGLGFALGVVPVATAWALVRPFEHALPVFPYAYGDWGTSAAAWSLLGSVALVALAAVLTGVRRWRPARP